MQLLDEKPEFEFLDGAAYGKMSPQRTHSHFQAAFILIITRCANGRGMVGPEWRFWPDGRPGRASLLPDVAFISYDRLRCLTDADAEEPPFSPDIAVEVRSPSTRTRFLHKKIARYLATGAVLVLDMNPLTRILTAHSATQVRTYESGARFAHAALPWLTFEMDELFAGLEIPR